MNRALTVVVASSAVIAACMGASAPAAPPLPESGSYDLSVDASTLLGGAPGTRAGWDVAPAGDVNGDGKPDIVVGAPHDDVGELPDAGAAYVLFGPVDDIQLDRLGLRGFRIEGAGAGDWAGWSVASMGDVNGDGRADIAVGAPFSDVGERDSGAAYIVFGKAGAGTVSLAALGEAGVAIAGGAADERTGFSVAAVPDVDADKLPELVLGAPTAGAGPNVTDAPGAAYLVFSKAFGDDTALAALGGNGYRMSGWPRSLSGAGVAGIPDLNGDGRGEIVVGAPGLMGAEEQRPGGAIVAWGKPTPEPIDLSDRARLEGFVILGGFTEPTPEGQDPPENARTAARWLGRDVAGVPDLDGDGLAEIMLGAPHTTPKQRGSAGAAYIVYGKADTDTLDVSYFDRAANRNPVRGSDAGVRIAGAAAGDLAGWSVGPAGDFDADGTQDVLVGAPAADALSREQAGAGYVVFGDSLDQNLDLAGLGERGVRIVGAEAGDYTGRSLAAVGDVSGDAVGDLLIGTPASDGPTGASILRGPKEEPPPPNEPPPPPPDPGVEEEEEIDGCQAVRNVEIVIDDSGSMADTDEELLRAEAVRLLLAKERNAEEVIGAVQFGTEASQVFPPTTIDPFGSENNREELERALRKIQADDGGTNYNAAFEVLVDENPGAGARIFLTDGGHNEGEYRELHRGGPPTFVIGFKIGREDNDGRRLQRIADETEGRYFANVTRRTLQRAVNAIDSRLNCDIELDFEEDPFEEEGEVEQDSVEIEEETNSADIVVSWGDDDDDFELVELALRRRGRTVARIGRPGIRRALARGASAQSSARRSATPRKLRVAGRRGKTFIALRALGLSRGRLVYKLRAKELRGNGRAATQVSQSRRVR